MIDLEDEVKDWVEVSPDDFLSALESEMDQYMDSYNEAYRLYRRFLKDFKNEALTVTCYASPSTDRLRYKTELGFT